MKARCGSLAALVAHRCLSREERFDMLVRDIFNRDIFARKRGEFVKGIDIIFYRMLAQMAYPNGEQVSILAWLAKR
jgi:hypothetical protein